MNKLKDILYDTNDILIALLILGCATLLIFTRVNDIMTYPERMVFGQSSQIESEVVSPDDDEVFTFDDYDDEIAEEPDAALEGAGGDDPTEEHTAFSLYIAYGESMNDVGRNLVELGFFNDIQDFHDTLTKYSAASRVQAGTFYIPAESTKEDVVKIITGRNY